MEHLIPTEWFTGQHWSLLLLISTAAMYALIKGANWLVDGASGIAYRVGISKIIVGATIVSLGTTSPECAVSVMAAWRGEAGLALGNAVGSIVADSGLIFGLGCLMVTLPADRFVLQRQGWVQFGSAVLLAGACYAMVALDPEHAALPRWFGAFLILLLAVYMVVSIKWSKAHAKGEPFQVHEEEDVKEIAQKPLAKQIAMSLVGLLIVLIFSDVLIKAVMELALQWGVKKEVLAATLVALGTSLPELVIGMAALRKGQYEILVGNVIGADILNVLFVIGVSASAASLPIPPLFLKLHLPAMLLILAWFRIAIFMAVRKGSFTRWHGGPLLAIYVIYLVLNYAMGMG